MSKLLLAMILLTFGTPTTQPSREGHFIVTLPDGWHAFDNSNMPGYDLYLTGPNRAALWATSEAKEDFADPEQALASYVEKQVSYSQNFVNGAEISEQQQIQVAGRNAVRFEVRGDMQGMKIVYVITVMETPARVISWTGVSMPSRIEQHRKVFDEIITTTRDAVPTSQPSGGR